MRSRRPEARPFQKWVYVEVLPSIRRSGFFVGKSLSAPKARHLAEAFLRAVNEQSLADGGHGLSEHRMCNDLAQRVVTEFPEWVPAGIGQWLHDCVYHPYARREKRAMRSYDPAQPYLPTLLSVMRDGRERWVDRRGLRRPEAVTTVTRNYRSRKGFGGWENGPG